MIIYGLRDPHTKEMRYVGKHAATGISRYDQHMKPSTYMKRKGHVYSWIKHLVSMGLKPEQVVLAECNSQEELNEAEKAFIAYFRGTSNRLTNHTDGGDGALGLKMSEEAKEKLRVVNLGKKYGPETKAKLSAMRQGPLHPMWGVKASDLCKQKVREANSKPVYCSNGKKYSSASEAARELGLRVGNISHNVRGIHKYAGNYCFSFSDPNVKFPIKVKVRRKITPVMRNDGVKFNSLNEAAKKSGTNRQAIRNVLNGLAHTCGEQKYSFALIRVGG